LWSGDGPHDTRCRRVQRVSPRSRDGAGPFVESLAAAVDAHDFPSPVTSEEVQTAEGVGRDRPVTAAVVPDVTTAANPET
jgi:hypothetical protein